MSCIHHLMQIVLAYTPIDVKMHFFDWLDVCVYDICFYSYAMLFWKKYPFEMYILIMCYKKRLYVQFVKLLFIRGEEGGGGVCRGFFKSNLIFCLCFTMSISI